MSAQKPHLATRHPQRAQATTAQPQPPMPHLLQLKPLFFGLVQDHSLSLAHSFAVQRSHDVLKERFVHTQCKLHVELECLQCTCRLKMAKRKKCVCRLINAATIDVAAEAGLVTRATRGQSRCPVPCCAADVCCVLCVILDQVHLTLQAELRSTREAYELVCVNTFTCTGSGLHARRLTQHFSQHSLLVRAEGSGCAKPGPEDWCMQLGRECSGV
jgi:hypothetical protein